MCDSSPLLEMPLGRQDCPLGKLTGVAWGVVSSVGEGIWKGSRASPQAFEELLARGGRGTCAEPRLAEFMVVRVCVSSVLMTKGTLAHCDLKAPTGKESSPLAPEWSSLGPHHCDLALHTGMCDFFPWSCHERPSADLSLSYVLLTLAGVLKTKLRLLAMDGHCRENPDGLPIIVSVRVRTLLPCVW